MGRPNNKSKAPVTVHLTSGNGLTSEDELALRGALDELDAVKGNSFRFSGKLEVLMQRAERRLNPEPPVPITIAARAMVDECHRLIARSREGDAARTRDAEEASAIRIKARDDHHARQAADAHRVAARKLSAAQEGADAVNETLLEVFGNGND